MIELSSERAEQILHEETVKKEDLETILRSIYTRFMCLYENFFADIDALNDEMIAELKNYHDETISLIKYYYMDIPLDIIMEINEFEMEYSANLLGSKWHDFLFGLYEDFRKEREDENKSDEDLMAEFTKQALMSFYESMDYIFRESFGTGSKTAENTLSGISGLLFGKKQ